MPLARWAGSIRKHVPQVTSAPGTHFLDAHHSITRVAQALDVRLFVRLEEARPTRTGIEFRAGTKQRQAAEPARVDAVLLVVEEDTTERRFRAMLKQNVALLVVESGSDLLALLGGRRVQVKGCHGDSSVFHDGSWARWLRPARRSVVTGAVLQENQGNRSEGAGC